jgi:hypothetical protein
MGKFDEAKKVLEQWMKQNKEFGYEKIFKENNGLLILGFGDCFFKGIDVVFEENVNLNESKIDTMDLHFVFTKIVESFILCDLEYIKVSTYDNLCEILINIELYSKEAFPHIDIEELRNIINEYGGKLKQKVKRNKVTLKITTGKGGNQDEMSFEDEMALLEDSDAKSN